MIHLLIPLFLAQAADPDPLKQVLPWVTTFVVAVLSVVLGRKMGKAEAQGIRVEDPVPTVPIRKVPGIPSWNDHSNLVERVARLEGHLDKLREEQAKQFKELLTAGANRQAEIVERLSEKIDTVAREWHGRLDSMTPSKPLPRR